MPFLTEDSRSGLYAADLAPIAVETSLAAVPQFSLHRVPLTSVQIPFELNAPLDSDGIKTARVELVLVGGVTPASELISVTLETSVNLYVAPGTAGNRFSDEYSIPLGRVSFGSATQVDLTGEMSEAQLEYLKAGTLMIGLEFAETNASVTYSGAGTFLYSGLSWELSALRVRGEASLQL